MRSKSRSTSACRGERACGVVFPGGGLLKPLGVDDLVGVVSPDRESEISWPSNFGRTEGVHVIVFVESLMATSSLTAGSQDGECPSIVDSDWVRR